MTLILLASCGKKKQVADNVLLRYGEVTLTRDEIIDRIPEGISAEDSVAMFATLVDEWITNQVLAEFAEERLYDTADIDRRVEDYRNSLIVREYIERMQDNQKPVVDEARIKDYYDRHRSDMHLEVPLVRGIFLKISTDVSHREKIKALLSSADMAKIDILEKDWMDKALQYDYFRDKWVDWETVAQMIPHRFGDPDEFLKANNYFEVEYDGCAYYLSVSEWLPSGEEQPYEFAKSWITTILTRDDLKQYETGLVNSLVEKAIKEKNLEVLGYDPVTHEVIEPSKVK